VPAIKIFLALTLWIKRAEKKFVKNMQNWNVSLNPEDFYVLRKEAKQETSM
jgi:hypothetical protein